MALRGVPVGYLYALSMPTGGLRLWQKVLHRGPAAVQREDPQFLRDAGASCGALFDAVRCVMHRLDCRGIKQGAGAPSLRADGEFMKSDTCVACGEGLNCAWSLLAQEDPNVNDTATESLLEPLVKPGYLDKEDVAPGYLGGLEEEQRRWPHARTCAAMDAVG